MAKYEVFIEKYEEGSKQDVQTVSAKSMKELELLFTIASNPRKVLRALLDAAQEPNPPTSVRRLVGRFSKK